MSNIEDQQLRNRRGQFAAPFAVTDLYQIVKEGARIAAKLDDDSLKDPAMVSERDFDDARGFLVSKWGRRIPPAREICRQLRDRDGHSYPWRELLTDVFNDSINFTQHHAQRLSQPDRTISDEHVYWALNHIAYLLEGQSLRPHEYEQGGKQLLEKAKPATPSRRGLEKALPTTNQITSHCGGSWDSALEIAQLQARSAMPPSRKLDALPVPVAMAFYYLAHGYLPSTNQLQAFRRREQFACQSNTGKAWEAWCTDAIALIRAQGLAEPPPYPSKIPHPSWQPVNLDLNLVAPGLTHSYSHLQALQAVHEFKLRLPANETPTDRRYKEFSRRKPGIPTLKVIQRHGGLAELIRQLLNPDWRERAERWDENHRTEQATRPKQPRPSRPRRRNPTRRIELMKILRRDGPTSARDLATSFSITPVAVHYLVVELEQRGFIERTEQNPRSSEQKYRLTPAGVNALEDEDELRELERPLSDRCLEHLAACHTKVLRTYCC